MTSSETLIAPYRRPLTLSPRMTVILTHVANGLTVKEIAPLVHLSHRTVSDLLNNQRLVWDVPNMAALVAKAFREGVIQ